MKANNTAVAYNNSEPPPTTMPPRFSLRELTYRYQIKKGDDGQPIRLSAYYQDAWPVYAVDSIECIGGSLPRTQSRLVEAWAELHREELVKNWQLLQSGHPPVKIAPLQ